MVLLAEDGCRLQWQWLTDARQHSCATYYYALSATATALAPAPATLILWLHDPLSTFHADNLATVRFRPPNPVRPVSPRLQPWPDQKARQGTKNGPRKGPAERNAIEYYGNSTLMWAWPLDTLAPLVRRETTPSHPLHQDASWRRLAAMRAPRLPRVVCFYVCICTRSARLLARRRGHRYSYYIRTRPSCPFPPNMSATPEATRITRRHDDTALADLTTSSALQPR